MLKITKSVITQDSSQHFQKKSDVWIMIQIINRVRSHLNKSDI